MNKNAKEKELLEEAYTSIYTETKTTRPELPGFDQTWAGGMAGPHKQIPIEPQESETSSPPSEDNEIEALIAADIGEDNEDDVDVDENKDEDKLVKVDDETEDAKYFGKKTPL